MLKKSATLAAAGLVVAGALLAGCGENCSQHAAKNTSSVSETPSFGKTYDEKQTEKDQTATVQAEIQPVQVQEVKAISETDVKPSVTENQTKRFL